MNGKGSKRRPCLVSQEEFASNWKRIFRYPSRCIECGKITVEPATLDHYEIDCLDNGRLHRVTVTDMHVLRCTECGLILFDNITDDQIQAALEKHLEHI
jgi:phage FluMu protein Com